MYKSVLQRHADDAFMHHTHRRSSLQLSACDGTRALGLLEKGSSALRWHRSLKDSGRHLYMAGRNPEPRLAVPLFLLPEDGDGGLTSAVPEVAAAKEAEKSVHVPLCVVVAAQDHRLCNLPGLHEVGSCQRCARWLPGAESRNNLVDAIIIHEPLDVSLGCWQGGQSAMNTLFVEPRLALQSGASQANPNAPDCLA